MGLSGYVEFRFLWVDRVVSIFTGGYVGWLSWGPLGWCRSLQNANPLGFRGCRNVPAFGNFPGGFREL